MRFIDFINEQPVPPAPPVSVAPKKPLSNYFGGVVGVAHNSPEEAPPGAQYSGYNGKYMSQMNKSQMTPEQKQQFWSTKLDQARKHIFQFVEKYIPIYAKTPLEQAIMKMIYQKVQKWANAVNANMRKGGMAAPAAPGTISSISAKTVGDYWNTSTEAVAVQQDKMQVFEQMKKRMISLMQTMEYVGAGDGDRDFGMIRSHLSKYLIGKLTALTARGG